jgi:hypothetical protein
MINELRFKFRRRVGKHRSYGISTYEMIKMIQVAREC